MKRQIANVNTHIFRHPFIPWGQRSYPLSLQPDLLLDAIDLDYLTLVGTDVSILGDQSGNGYDFTQVTAANRPVVDSATVPSQIDFTAANSEFLENTLDVSTFAAMSQGSIVYVPTPNGTGNVWVFTIQDADLSTNFIRVGTNSSGKAALTLRNSSVGGTLTLTSTTSVTSANIVEWKSSGSIYQCMIDGVDDIVIGTNDGKWMDYPSGLDGMAIGTILLTPISLFYDLTFKHLMIRSTPLSDAESLTYANYLIQKHSL